MKKPPSNETIGMELSKAFMPFPFDFVLVFAGDFLGPPKFRHLHSGGLPELDRPIRDLECGLSAAMLDVHVHGSMVVAVEEEPKSFDGENGGHGEWEGMEVRPRRAQDARRVRW